MSDVLAQVASIAAQAPAPVVEAPTESTGGLASAVEEAPAKKGKNYPPLKDFEDHAITEAVVELVAWIDPTGNPPRRIAETTGQSYAATWHVMTDGNTEVHPAWVAILSTVVLGAVLGLRIWKGEKAEPEPVQAGGLGLAGNL